LTPHISTAERTNVKKADPAGSGRASWRRCVTYFLSTGILCCPTGEQYAQRQWPSVSVRLSVDQQVVLSRLVRQQRWTCW